MESTDSSLAVAAAGGSHHQSQPPPPPQPQLPPGFRFHPTDEELVVHYLKRKAQSAPLPVSIIAEIDLYKFDPWELPAKAVFGEQEWYFFSPRDRKYPNGARPNRAATSGYWKATGTDKPVLTAGNQKVGVKKALVFYGGKPPRGVKTNWIMHEYRLADNKPNNKPPGYDTHPNNKKGSLRLDDWVLCRIYKKNNTHRAIDHEREDSMEDMMMMGPMSVPSSINFSKYGSLLEAANDQAVVGGIYEGMIGNNNPHHHGGGSMDLTSSSTLPLKRTMLPPSLYWTGTDQEPHSVPGAGSDASGGASSSKRLSSSAIFHHQHNNNNINNQEDGGKQDHHEGSIASLLNQLPAQTPSLHQTSSMLGTLSDGVFRQPYPMPGLNWYS